MKVQKYLATSLLIVLLKIIAKIQFKKLEPN